MTRIRRILPFLLAVSCLLALLFLSGCGPGIYIFWHGVRVDRGDWPTPTDSPYSKWICRERDLYFCMWADDVRDATGEYRSGDTVWHIQGEPNSLWGCIRFTFNTADSREVSEQTDENGVPYAKLSRGKEALVAFDYLYQNGAMTCKVTESDHEDFQKGDTFTFDKAPISQTLRARFRCQEMDMWLDAFEATDDFYTGMIVIDGTAYHIRVLKCSDTDCYTVYWYYPEGQIQYIPAETFITFQNQKMIWSLTDASPELPKDFPDGIFSRATLTFVEKTVPQD